MEESRKNNLNIIQTDDGSNTLFSSLYEETFHSKNGAVTEGNHVFIKNGLVYLNETGKKNIRILEVGFGTGLNAMLSCEYALENNLNIHYTGIDKYEIPVEVFDSVGYNTFVSGRSFDLIKNLQTDQNESTVSYANQIHLRRVHTDFVCWTDNEKFDLVYFDAFSPEINPELWNPDIYSKVWDLLNENGILVTYCAQGQFKRDLKQVGFKIESLPGAPGKREMTRARKIM